MHPAHLHFIRALQNRSFDAAAGYRTGSESR
jgi:hypothetical protein